MPSNSHIPTVQRCCFQYTELRSHPCSKLEELILITPKRNPLGIPLHVPPAPGNHSPTFCLYESAHCAYFI